MLMLVLVFVLVLAPVREIGRIRRESKTAPVDSIFADSGVFGIGSVFRPPF